MVAALLDTLPIMVTQSGFIFFKQQFFWWIIEFLFLSLEIVILRGPIISQLVVTIFVTKRVSSATIQL